MSYTISEVASRMGITPSTIRYYDKEELIPNIKRKNGQRVFEEIDLRFLALLTCLKNTGMPLKRIREYVDMTKEGDKTLKERYKVIQDQRQFVQDQIEQLRFYLEELDFKDWYYQKAIGQGTEQGITFEDYGKETGKQPPEIDIINVTNY